jgi:hypothetical protein
MRSIRTAVVGICVLARLSGVALAQNECNGGVNQHPEHPCGGQDCKFDFSKSALENINIARATENPEPPQLVLPDGYAQALPGQKVIMLLNAERKSRGYWTVNHDVDGRETNDNDPLLSVVALNHSKLLSDIPNIGGMLNPDGNPTAHNNAVDGTVADRVASLPVFNGNPFAFGGAGEAIAGGSNPEMAIWGFLYTDKGSNWGHRDGLLGSCAAKIMGVGVFQADSFGNGNVTIDGINNDENKYPRVPQGAPRPTPLPVTITAEAVEFDNHVSGKYHIAVAWSEDFSTIDYPHNYVKWIYIWAPATWSKPDGPDALGIGPVGKGGSVCPLTGRGSSGSTSSGDNSWAWTIQCDVIVPYKAPHQVTITDRYSNTQVFKECSDQPDPTCFRYKH